jgi:hypothetical protein
VIRGNNLAENATLTGALNLYSWRENLQAQKNNRYKAGVILPPVVPGKVFMKADPEYG